MLRFFIAFEGICWRIINRSYYSSYYWFEKFDPLIVRSNLSKRRFFYWKFWKRSERWIKSSGDFRVNCFIFTVFLMFMLIFREFGWEMVSFSVFFKEFRKEGRFMFRDWFWFWGKLGICWRIFSFLNVVFEYIRRFWIFW